MRAISEYIDRLANALTESGHLTDPKWRSTLHAVPRHLFAPALAWSEADGQNQLVDRDQDEAAWLSTVYSDTSIITQLDDGATPLEAGGDNYTSSLSAPGVVVAFLELLNPYDRHRVLEIGTGTGWTAALLAHRVGHENVTSVEVDASLGKQAAANLEAAGFFPNLIIGDGATVRPDGGPFDRVHVTCGVSMLPYAWVEQTRPGGVIAFPYVPGFAYGHKARLTVTNDGRAIGRFSGDAGYMMLRSQRFGGYMVTDAEPGQTTTRIDPRTIAWDSYGCDVAMAGMLPGVITVEEVAGGGSFCLQLHEPAGSWARAAYEPGNDVYRVEQAGGRRLWDEVEAAYFTWLGWGSPGRGRFGMTVLPNG
ncbi:MAG TPA: methyltransferase domain-containing protein, partial [Streptosporangiaceae bacterium]